MQISAYFLEYCPNDDKAQECLLRNGINLGPMFAHGYEPLNMTSLNPIVLDEMVISPKSRGLLISAENFSIYNAHNYTIKKHWQVFV